MSDAKDKAIQYALKAYDELKSAGLSLEYLSILNDVVLNKRSIFFGEFGSDTGVSLTISSSENLLSRIVLTVTIVKYRRKWINWIKDVFSTIFGQDCEYQIFLNDQDAARLRDLFRGLT